MKSLFTLSALVLPLTLAGCSNKPLPPTEKVVKTTVIKADNGSTLKIDGYEQLKTDFHKPTDTALRYITRSDTSKVVALKTLSFIAGAFAGGAQESGFTKYELVGTPITTLSNPSVTYFSEEMEKSLKSSVAEKAAGQLQNPIEIRPYVWMLVYENLSGGENFELHYSTVITRSKDHPTKKYDVASLNCTPEPIKAPLAEWEANNYQKVNEVTRNYMARCLRDFNETKDQFLQ
ncbi:hypothetical protein GA0061071_11094 [Kosakonia oryzendophytica]|uniref:Lipoprotein n=1 Tax=Kosakonia oryzendophytica TaxID=1005665 RepID=A0A1C4D588_9ENTR|nr:hypothetical protein [Kosakonia oryzendophytica]SCC26482.1 hypothetical protein GA0061071_11094 [Kosakonia oryzendophytica]